MKAIVIREPGDEDVLELREVADPPMGRDDVRVAVKFAGCNRADLLQRAGHYPPPPGAPKDIPGLEYAGEVVEIGANVRSLEIGARVHGIVSGGAYAEGLAVHARETVRIPDGVAFETAAAIPEAFVTAYDALAVRGRVRPGERVLVHAAGSGVGTAVIQLAKAMGCVVVGTSRTASKLERARELGLDVGIVTTKEALFSGEVLDATNGEGVDVVVDLVGGALFEETLRACAPRARIVCVGLTAGARSSLDLGLLLRKRLEIIGTVLRSRPLEEKIAAAKLLASPIDEWLTRGLVRPIVDEVFPLASASDAHRLLATDSTFGKVLLAVC